MRRRVMNSKRQRRDFVSPEDPDVARMRAKERRRYIYENKLYAKHIGGNVANRFKSTPLPEDFKKNLDLQARVIPFIRRELQVLLRDTEVEFVKDYVLIVLEKFDVQSQTAIELIRQFVMDETEHFVHELVCFMRSPFNVDAWDQIVQYDEKSGSTLSIVGAASGSGSVSGSGNDRDQDQVKDLMTL
ncbi:hypothetical protein HDU97_007575 [Phlyctochytrium planicorne]|nr:hypothetical protein HDU97_007575 [Phlyctochytrium planicorne]